MRRRAPRLYRVLTESGSSKPLDVMDWVNAYALAVNEENAAGGRVVTAPTNGAAGIVPAVLHYYRRFEAGANDEGVIRFLLVAAAIPAWSAQPVRARHGMVVTRERHATEAGIQILEAGGNAVDAAVAVGFALAVTHPSAGNIGGGGFMLIRLADGRTTFIDFRERAPGAALRNMYIDA